MVYGLFGLLVCFLLVLFSCFCVLDLTSGLVVLGFAGCGCVLVCGWFICLFVCI